MQHCSDVCVCWCGVGVGVCMCVGVCVCACVCVCSVSVDCPKSCSKCILLQLVPSELQIVILLFQFINSSVNV